MKQLFTYLSYFIFLCLFSFPHFSHAKVKLIGLDYFFSIHDHKTKKHIMVDSRYTLQSKQPYKLIIRFWQPTQILVFLSTPQGLQIYKTSYDPAFKFYEIPGNEKNDYFVYNPQSLINNQILVVGFPVTTKKTLDPMHKFLQEQHKKKGLPKRPLLYSPPTTNKLKTPSQIRVQSFHWPIYFIFDTNKLTAK